MIIVLDTNILEEDPLLQSARFEVLLDFVKKTKSKIALPKLVLDELLANYRRELIDRLTRTRRTIELLNGLLPENDRCEVPTIDVELAATRFRERTLATLRVSADGIIPLKGTYLEQVVERAILRLPPCTDRGEEIRDALLWLTVKDIAAESKEVVVFISRNTKQFTRNKVDLHPDLQTELSADNLDLRYLISLEAFSREHASHIAFITPDWINQHISVDALIEGFRGIIESYVQHQLDIETDSNESSTGYVNLIGGSLDLKEYFVYAMSDGSFRIELSYSGQVEVEYEIEREEETEQWDYDYEFDSRTGQHEYRPVTRTVTQLKTRTKTTDPELSVVVNATVENGEVTEWSAVDGWFD